MGFLHLAVARRERVETLLRREVTAIAYETIQNDDGVLPVQVPLSKAAGLMAPQLQLKLNYYQILALIGAAFVAKALMQPVWGAFAHRRGADRLLWIGGLGIIPHAALWLVSPSFAYLLVMQLFAGAMLSAYELATLLLMFDHLKEEERTSLWSIFNLLNSAAMVAGSLLGGALLRAEPGIGGYQVIFLLSLAARLATVIYLRLGREGRPAERLLVGVDAVRATAGSIDRPLLTPATPSGGGSIMGDGGP